MKPYIPPRFSTCVCGAEVVYEFGKLDGAAYRNGIVQRHACDYKIELEPFNEKEWLALVEQGSPPPAPPEPPPPPKRRRRELDQEGGNVGGIQI